MFPQSFLFYIATFCFGLIIGSFLNAVIYRLYYGYSLGGFSFCPSCRHRLSARDLIPLLSFIVLRGKCRYCGHHISWQYPSVEAVTGTLFVLFVNQAIQAGTGWFVLIFNLITASVLLVIFTFDFRYYLIPDVAVLIGASCALAFRLISGGAYPISDGLLGVLVVAGFFGILYLISKGKWIGFGDVKLGIFLGMLLGLAPSLMMLLVAYVSGAMVGVVLVITGKRSMQGMLPFGTFLSAAAIIMMLWGNDLISWYKNLIYF